MRVRHKINMDVVVLTTVILFIAGIFTYNIAITNSNQQSFIPVSDTLDLYSSYLGYAYIPLILIILFFSIKKFLLGIYLLKSGFSIREQLLYYVTLPLTPRNKNGVVIDSKSENPIHYCVVSLLKKEKSVDGKISYKVIEKTHSNSAGVYSFSKLVEKGMSIRFDLLGYKSLLIPYSSRPDASLSFLELSKAQKLILGIINIVKKIPYTYSSISLAGFCFSIYTYVFDSTTINLLLIFFYSLTFVLTFYPNLVIVFLKKLSFVDVDDSPLKGVIVRIYSNKDLIDIAVSKRNGSVKVNANEGIYRINAYKKNYQSKEDNIEISEENTNLVIKIEKLENLTNLIEK